MLLKRISAALVAAVQLCHGMVSYSGEKVVRFWVDADGLEVERRELLSSVLNCSSCSIWTVNSKFMDVHVGNSEDLTAMDSLTSIMHEVIVEDLDSAIRGTFPVADDDLELWETVHASGSQQNFQVGGPDSKLQVFHALSGFFFKEFRDLRTLNIWFALLKETFPQLVEIEEYGETPEGNKLQALHLAAHNQELNPERKTVMSLEGSMQGSRSAYLQLALSRHSCLPNYDTPTGKRETQYLNSLDFIFVPVFNPDGYNYTWTSDRLWRKNRQETYLSSCRGIDIDRSFGYEWSSSDDFPCNENYAGEVPFEAVEARLWSEYLYHVKRDYKIYGFLDLHSYSQEILYPYAYSCESVPRDLENLMELSFGLSKAIRAVSGKHYDVLPACKDRGSDLTPGLGSGSALDFMYHNRAHWAFQIKLRDTGNHGFLLPPKYIEPVGREAYGAFKYFCDFILDPEN
ncbi:putative metallocarboxypeptidase KNAG_0H03670 [Huiozyma naganishii CBS 8797]|uniref:Inactive metallocarboxypeptidase ECM14 n=1 Tax=Huiozyma naganishii (strain ATCC MYA-139 / BCRC 22969 / CBS 8797 / KCTC 17520 / NBRC 10181 / NCYC 3082 / Yp74L-3) TaxID=1071383 RepID=J7S9X9_HUIN7|nr:hypothetical protein KNAG_0H03670 [Kazachstania naganishii CBS 8797]CCK71781.1 hypothetical protein KNAG_0H03670 [Kazachstania naganishii CBS 8797]